MPRTLESNKPSYEGSRQDHGTRGPSSLLDAMIDHRLDRDIYWHPRTDRALAQIALLEEAAGLAEYHDGSTVDLSDDAIESVVTEWSGTEADGVTTTHTTESPDYTMPPRTPGDRAREWVQTFGGSRIAQLAITKGYVKTPDDFYNHLDSLR